METWSDAGDYIIHPNLHPKKKKSCIGCFGPCCYSE
uniref:Uncharacterized protein n=1 Tax=viral metagenome TaxID=1070528 RepID=A0A6C0ERW3_9ZZZZ